MSAPSVTAKDFEEKVLKAKEPVLVDFWASWCGPCQMLSPIIGEIAEEAKDFKVYAVNADEEQELQGFPQRSMDFVPENPFWFWSPPLMADRLSILLR